MQFKTYFTAVQMLLSGVAGVNIVSAERIGLDFGDAPNENTEQYKLMAGFCWQLYVISDFPCDAFIP